MRIAMVCPYDLGLHGGVQDQAIRLRRWLGDMGHEVTLVGPGVEGPTDAILLGGTRSVTANRAATPLKLDPRVRSQIAEILEGADVAHIHEPLMPMVSITATRVGNRPKVGTFHADPPAWVRRGYRGTGMLLKRVVSKLDVVTATSPVSRSAIEGFTESRIVANGIDRDAYSAAEKVPNSVAFLGRDDERKGLAVLLAAWPRIAEAVEGATLTVMSADRPSDRDDVTFLGRVSEEHKASVLGSSEIYCAPNLGGESFGIVLAEAMASRCAVVASAIPAFAYVAADAAELVAPGDVLGLAERIITLLRDSDRRRSLQAAALHRSASFEGTVVATEFVHAYEDAIAAHARA